MIGHLAAKDPQGPIIVEMHVASRWKKERGMREALEGEKAHQKHARKQVMREPWGEPSYR
jgi:hypothetical protein